MKHNLIMALTNTLGFTPNCLDDAKDFHQIQAAAVKSLERIQSIYEQIMTPSDINLPTPSFELEEHRTPPDSPVSEHSGRHPGVPSKAAFNELCNNCKNVISHCHYCKSCIYGDSMDGFENNIKYFREETHRKRHYRRNSSEAIKVTVPQPFALSHMDVSRQAATEAKMLKLKEELKNEKEKEMRVKIRSRPVPKSTRLPLYEKMVEDGNKRKAQRKEIGMELSRNPVRFDAVSTAPEEKQKTFKAKPVPEHILSDKVSERLKNKEEIRKMMIAQRAEEILRSAHSPFSRRPQRTRSEVNLTDVVRKSDSKTTKKNISAITDRLYVKKCRETMDDWNKKVLEFNKKGESGKQSKPSLPLSALPFSFFPIRMSNAAMSREKQIREEILARKKREDSRSDSEEETTRRKKEALSSILPRLKNLLPVFDSQREIEDKVKNFRATQTHRKREYEKELEEIMMRVSKQLLLIERQSKVSKEDAEQSRGGGSSGDPDGQSDVSEEEDAESEASEDPES